MGLWNYAQINEHGLPKLGRKNINFTDDWLYCYSPIMFTQMQYCAKFRYTNAYNNSIWNICTNILNIITATLNGTWTCGMTTERNFFFPFQEHQHRWLRVISATECNTGTTQNLPFWFHSTIELKNITIHPTIPAHFLVETYPLDVILVRCSGYIFLA